MHCDQCGSMIPERKTEVTQYTLCYLCFCYHSISFYACKSIYFFIIRVKFNASVFSGVYFIYTPDA